MKKNDPKKFPLVSIIVPTRNSYKTLRKSLLSINKQSYQNIELIVVDNHSKDKTLKAAKQYADKVLIKGPERSEQRNFGFLHSKGDYIAWFDSDMELSTSVISECVEKIRSNMELSALIIPEKSVGVGFWAKCRALEKTCYLEDQSIEAIRFIDKKTFKNIGGFSINFISGEDWNITSKVRKIGGKIDRISSYVIHKEGKLSLSSDIRKKYYYATKSKPYIDVHIRKPIDVVLFLLRPAFFRNWRILLSDPIHTLGLLFMKICEFSAGFLGVLVSFASSRQ